MIKLYKLLNKNRMYAKKSTLLDIIKFELFIRRMKKRIKSSHFDIDRVW